MRVLMISWEFPPHVVGGIGRHVAELSPALAGLATAYGPVQIDVITPRNDGGAPVEQVAPGLTVYRVEMPPMDVRDLYNDVIANNSCFVETAMALYEQRPYDLIHIHEWQTGMAGITLKHRWKTPLLATVHATERGRHQGYLPSSTSEQIDQLEWRICFDAWRVIVCSQFMRQELNQYFGAPLDKLDVIFNGIQSHHALHSSSEQAAVRRQFARPDEKLLFFIGRITHEKGLQVLLRAMPRILADHPDLRLLVAGKNCNKMWPLAYELNVERAVDFLGFISDAERDNIYQVADGAVFPSLYEPFGIVALEAMAMDCNVIASDVGGLGEVVKHLDNGLTVLPNDPLSIVWAVNQLFADPQAAVARRRRALDEIRTIYRWDELARQTALLYEQIVRQRAQVDW
jgi:glycogen(starch) synthase